MEGDVYYLKDKEGYVQCMFVVDSDDGALFGKCYNSYTRTKVAELADYNFVADVYCKLGGCTHWHFYGDDYEPGITEDSDSYYHLCGGHCFMEHITALCFTWKLAAQILTKDVESSYYHPERLKNLIESVLDGYEIVKG